MATRTPLACTPGAIPEAERYAHFELARWLFAERATAAKELEEGREYRFPPHAFAEVARFVENERRCCPFLSFALLVEPNGREVRLRITGPPGTGGFLNAELPTVEVTDVEA